MDLRLTDFEGEWTLERTIDDALAGQSARMTGKATFTPEDDGLRMTERGRLEMEATSQSFDAEREYVWRSAPNGIAVYFDDGRLFHLFETASACPTADHDCPPDDYSVAYDFSEWPVWTARWRVKGPRKDYVSTTVFAPISAET
ncbi:DUF6314 family protein [Celeribacter litoreus]|uniref:DUF6314 family protein n=1 Tax=Celeribacter litoreus TaxID=2876714 RepID=UPI001CCF836D|nr:DUF6314 family protein [Celeribacter litoreus]